MAGDCVPCGAARARAKAGQTSHQLNASAAGPIRYEVTRPDGSTEQYTSLVDALRERNRTRGTYRQVR